MKQYKFKSILLMLAISLISFISCNNNQKNETKDTVANMDEEENLSQQDIIEITLGSNDNMQFDKSEIIVFDGQTVILTLIHTGTMPITAMGHNFVLLAKGTSTSKFAKRALDAKDNEYIPEDESDIIAYTGLIGGGESVTITFNAPEKGTYDFLCSFPGHYSIMKGKFIVK